ncbi:MAG: hypothetical protein IKN07_02640 [Lachnospiraceae bacterium]|nr:hypothetical protein [Lachnospiraceae bacterium]
MRLLRIGRSIPAARYIQKTKSNKLGIKQLMAGGGIFIVGLTLVPLLSGLFSTT